MNCARRIAADVAPLRARYQAQYGELIELGIHGMAAQNGRGEITVGEDTRTIRHFLKSAPPQVWRGGEKVTSTMRVTGFPTTLVINSKGQVTARHLGPLTRAQLLGLQRQAKENP